MKVILNQDIPNLGEEGDIKDVAPGYARNFLMPRKLVMRYDEASLAMLETRREEISQRKEEKRKAALSLKERLESDELQVHMPAGANGRLYGSVTAAKIADELEKIGVSVERKRIDILENTIKATGPTTVKVGLYGGEVASLRVNVVGQDVQGRSGDTQAGGAKATQAATADTKVEEDRPEEQTTTPDRTEAAEPSEVPESAMPEQAGALAETEEEAQATQTEDDADTDHAEEENSRQTPAE